MPIRYGRHVIRQSAALNASRILSRPPSETNPVIPMFSPRVGLTFACHRVSRRNKPAFGREASRPRIVRHNPHPRSAHVVPRVTNFISSDLLSSYATQWRAQRLVSRVHAQQLALNTLHAHHPKCGSVASAFQIPPTFYSRERELRAATRFA